MVSVCDITVEKVLDDEVLSRIRDAGGNADRILKKQPHWPSS